VDAYVFGPAWTFAPIYIASIYIPFIILYEALATEVEEAAVRCGSDLNCHEWINKVRSKKTIDNNICTA
jgi:hypothetical protein